jgi:hypothetical protein
LDEATFFVEQAWSPMQDLEGFPVNTTIWDLITAAGSALDMVDKAPYASRSENNYYELFCKSKRADDLDVGIVAWPSSR